LDAGHRFAVDHRHHEPGRDDGRGLHRRDRAIIVVLNLLADLLYAAFDHA